MKNIYKGGYRENKLKVFGKTNSLPIHFIVVVVVVVVISLFISHS